MTTSTCRARESSIGLPWLTARGATAGGGGRRAADIVLPAGGVLLCGFLLLHTGWRSVLVAGLVGAVGVLVAPTPRRAERT